jgi:hypothetical protein
MSPNAAALASRYVALEMNAALDEYRATPNKYPHRRFR